VTVVFVHGVPETRDIWDPLREVLDREAVAVALPGFGTPRPPGFTGTKDDLVEWLAMALRRVDAPVDVVGHDIGALLTMRIASGFDVPLRSWTVDVANIFHPEAEWPEQVHDLQTPRRGEAMLRSTREAPPDDPQSTAARLVGAGVPPVLARVIGTAHDEVMSQSILDFYRSAVPNAGAGWWSDVTCPTRSPGLVLLLPDPPDEEARSMEVAQWLGATTARLEGLNHCWMAEAPDMVAPILERFWSSLRSPSDPKT
jgi:pimeloyl-ACP methyl ester carboxylesterase